MSCWIMPSHFGSGYLPDPAGFSTPCSGARWRTYAAAPPPVSSLLNRMNRTERSVSTSAGTPRCRVAAASTCSAAPCRHAARGIDLVGRVVPELAAVVLVLDALRVRATIGLELRFDPVDGGAIAIGTLPAVAELRQPFDRRLVPVEVEPRDHRPHRIGCGVLRRAAT